MTILGGIAGVLLLIYVFKLLSKIWRNDLFLIFKIILTLAIGVATIALFYLVGHVLIYNLVINLGGL